MKNHVEKYLDRYAEKGPWKLEAASLRGIRNAVVIPALAEYPTILETLYSLSLNSPLELARTLVVCVVNNRVLPHAGEEEVVNNGKTLSVLRFLMRKEGCHDVEPEDAARIERILRSEIRLGCVDASSRGLELPVEGGVGLARKIGMDLSLAVLDDKGARTGLLLSLDADTLVEPSYLHEIRNYFRRKKALAAVVSYAHRSSPDAPVADAIACYESFLRYYLIGLRYARSPYAFHTIGSTIVSSARGYAMVRGMPKRLAGEDFYFLNKLTKISPVGVICGTTVFPSPRISLRTPFGTGNQVERLLQDEKSENHFYDPDTFVVLRDWLALMEGQLHLGGDELLSAAGNIDPFLKSFLNEIHFPHAWNRLKRNFPLRKNLSAQLHTWFDGLKTLRLIHFLTEKKYPKISMVEAVRRVSAMLGTEIPEGRFESGESAVEILTCLRELEKMLYEPGRIDITT